MSVRACRPSIEWGKVEVEAPSGQVVRHRQSRAGNHMLNDTLYMMAIVQIHHPPSAR
jgi:hypothetical protein